MRGSSRLQLALFDLSHHYLCSLSRLFGRRSVLYTPCNSNRTTVTIPNATARTYTHRATQQG